MCASTGSLVMVALHVKSGQQGGVIQVGGLPASGVAQRFVCVVEDKDDDGEVLCMCSREKSKWMSG